MMEELDFRSRYMELDDKTDELKEWIDEYGPRCCEFSEHFEISWIYHENALEGVVLTYHEIKAAIDQKIISDVNLISTYQEIKNQKEAVEFVRRAAGNKRTRINLEFIKKLHGILCNDVEGSEVGRYRRDIPLHRTYFHEITQPAKIAPRLAQLLQGANSNDFRRWHPIKQAAAFHHEFMQIFPFSEHSGMVGRMLMNYYLMRAGYMPAVIHSVDRQRYYESLRGVPRALRELIVDSMDNSLESGIRYLHELVQGPQSMSAQ
ncbi:MAG: Fic family protein [Pseudomonadota bacterium]